jgi:RNA polymerase sigma factor (sigma-70 family)
MSKASDLTELFLAAARSSSKMEQNDVWQRLYSVLKPFALRALLSLNGFSFPHASPEDFVQEAMEHLRRKADKYDPDQGPVEPWLCKVLSNFAKDWVRKKKRAEGPRASIEVENVKELSDVPQWPDMDFHGPLTDSQLALLAGWQVHQRLAAICLLGQWQRMLDYHPQLWEEWIANAEIPRPFPPDGFGSLTPDQRRECLAGVFHVNSNTVVQWLIRLRKRCTPEVEETEP